MDGYNINDVNSVTNDGVGEFMNALNLAIQEVMFALTGSSSDVSNLIYSASLINIGNNLMVTYSMDSSLLTYASISGFSNILLSEIKLQPGLSLLYGTGDKFDIFLTFAHHCSVPMYLRLGRKTTRRSYWRTY